MTVQELIDQLSKLDPKATVLRLNDEFDVGVPIHGIIDAGPLAEEFSSWSAEDAYTAVREWREKSAQEVSAASDRVILE